MSTRIMRSAHVARGFHGTMSQPNQGPLRRNVQSTCFAANPGSDDLQPVRGLPFGLCMRFVPVTRSTSRVFMAWRPPSQTQAPNPTENPVAKSVSRAGNDSDKETAAKADDLQHASTTGNHVSNGTQAENSIIARHAARPQAQQVQEQLAQGTQKRKTWHPLQLVHRATGLPMKLFKSTTMKLFPKLTFHVSQMTIMDGDAVFLRQQSIDWLNGAHQPFALRQC